MPANKIYWYVLFVRTGTEEKLVGILQNVLDSESYLPFVPYKICVFRRQGKKSLFQKICFPGYVFIESNKITTEFIKDIFPAVYRLEDVYRLLSYSDRLNIAMRDEECIALSKFLGNDHKIDISTGFKDGDSIRIISGALEGNESRILRINKGRGEAVVEIKMFGSTISVSVGFEMVEKVTDISLRKEADKK